MASASDPITLHESLSPLRGEVCVWCVVSAIVGLLLIGCTTHIRPPGVVREAETVLLVDHGRTPSLMLRAEDDADQRWVRYAYGDWDYYALRRNDVFHGLLALFWPTRGALGRGEVVVAGAEASVAEALTVGVERVYALEVERADVARLRSALDDLHRANAATLVVNEPYGLEFVHHPDKYTILHNSNHAVADWLRELGCEVRGSALVSSWRVEHAEP